MFLMEFEIDLSNLQSLIKSRLFIYINEFKKIFIITMEIYLLTL